MSRKAVFITASIIAVVVVAAAVTLAFYYGPPTQEGTSPTEARRKEAEARKRFAFQSLEGRIPRGKAIPLSRPLSPEAAQRWDAIEWFIEVNYARRAALLKALHEKTRDFFVKSRGFGANRDLRIPDEWILLAEYGPEDIPQPGYPAAFPVSSGDILKSVEPEADHFSIHGSAVLGFLHPSGFGYIKDRSSVAGFKSHGFTTSATLFEHSRVEDGLVGPKWKIENILLVGILSNDRPLVYMTDHLPSMEQINRGLTRWLDAFEEPALKALKDGEDLCIIRKDDTLRMLGALRATSQCLKCHEAQRGDLLGAFSYTLTQVKAGDSP
jgi:hypothetical protein